MVPMLPAVFYSGEPKTLGPTIDAAFEKGIPTVTLFSDIPGKKLTALVGNEQESGRVIAETILKNHPESSTRSCKAIVSLEMLGNPNTMDRMAGIRAALAKFPNIEVLPPVLDSADDAKATEAIG